MKWHKKYEEGLKRDKAEGKINYCQRCRLEEEPWRSMRNLDQTSFAHDWVGRYLETYHYFLI
jgi:hypothetical protein